MTTPKLYRFSIYTFAAFFMLISVKGQLESSEILCAETTNNALIKLSAEIKNDLLTLRIKLNELDSLKVELKQDLKETIKLEFQEQMAKLYQTHDAVKSDLGSLESTVVQSLKQFGTRLEELQSSQNQNQDQTDAQLSNVLKEIVAVKETSSTINIANEAVKSNLDSTKSQLVQKLESLEPKLIEVFSSNLRAANQTAQLLDDVSTVKNESRKIGLISEATNKEISWIKSQWSSKWSKLDETFNELMTVFTARESQNVTLTTRNTLNGRIQSDQHRTKNYTANTNQTWNIVAPQNHKIRFTIEWLDLEEDYDCLEGTAGASATSLFKLCGRFENTYYPHEIISDSNEVKLQFQTDSSTERTGFSLFYESYYEVPQAVVPVVTFYNERQFKGRSMSFTITLANQCYNLPSQHKNQVRSINTGGRCIKLFQHSYCGGLDGRGNYIRLYPGGRVEHYQLPSAPSLSYDGKGESFSSCLYTGGTDETPIFSMIPN